ncbi:MAG TPA: alpha/beta hydrolase [Blastocatellia bacterium]|nr:alpha/beta hydrolase [Blastocatellia bacterium]
MRSTFASFFNTRHKLSLLNWAAFVKNLRSSKNVGWRLARIGLMTFAGVAILIMGFEDRLIYFPSKYPEGLWDVSRIPQVEGEIVPNIEDCYFVTSDGVKLHGWFCTPRRTARGSLEPIPADMVLLWFHGNAGNVTDRYDMIRVMMGIPVQVFIVDYRGYGKSEGSPSEQGLYLDARAAWDYLVSERGVRPGNIIILGKSLGGVPAIDLASKVDPAGLIVQSSFTSAHDMAAAVMPLLPRFLIHSRMESVKKIPVVRCPKLFIHSPRDEVVPYELGRRLFDAASEPKQFYTVEGAGHNETYFVGGNRYVEAVRQFVESCRPPE